ncbi:hypothetical protein [Acidiphilium acidophilum]|uniref:hypothetical protein n=1 Tax=Acidiphilium acidophilum TaxID=76588 RepID=UPI002E8E7579|nr:hypothetical protein [Acidiphilium acidophilum]
MAILNYPAQRATHHHCDTSASRFPGPLQNTGSGTRKSIKFRDRTTIKQRDPAQISIQAREIRCQPFLIIGLIAAIRRVLVVTLQSS